MPISMNILIFCGKICFIIFLVVIGAILLNELFIFVKRVIQIIEEEQKSKERENKKEETKEYAFLAKTIELLDLLDAPGGKDYFGELDYTAICESIKKASKFLSEISHYYTGHYPDSGTVSDWQATQTSIFFGSLEAGNIRSAYHSLWDTIDNRGKGRLQDTYISRTDFVLYYSLLRNFSYFIKMDCNISS